MRRYLITLALSFLTLIVSAQIGSGQWKIHPYFINDNINNCIDAGSKVYYLSGGYLYSYDKASQTNSTVDAAGVINDNNVRQIYYSVDKGNLYIVYENCNIDIIDQQGKVVNLSAIKDVVMPKNKVINDVTFAGGKAYVATTFGYIVIDEDSFAITEVRNYSYSLISVAIVGDHKIMCYNNRFYYSNATDQMESFSKYNKVDNPVKNGKILPINDSKFFLLTDSALYKVAVTSASDGTLTFSPERMEGEIPTNIQCCPNGFVASHYYYYTKDQYGNKTKNFRDYYYTWDQNGSNPTQHNGVGVFSAREAGDWWAANANGLTHVVNGVPGDYATPNGISIRKRAYWSTYDSSQQRVLLCRTAENRVLEEWDASTNTEVNSWNGSLWNNITPPNIGDYGGNYWIVVSPNEPNTYFYCSRKTGGIAKVQNDSIVIRYTPSNSLVSERASALAFDSQGNLWSAQPYYSDGSPDAMVLSAEKQAQDHVVKADFVANDMGGACKHVNNGFKRMAFGIGANDIKVFSAGNYNDPLIIWENNDDLSLKRYKVFNSFNDQENKYFSTYGWVYVKPDNDGIIWLGTVSGVISLDPREAFDEDFRINRMKVIRREGAEVNDILLEGTQVNCIDCDAQNRKWLATNTNGVFFVSADGSEIIKHFDVSNSPLPNDQVYSVCCNRATNSVLIVTGSGVLEYFYDMTPAASDYSNVYAYPNPVQSTFTGYITIKGLMDNSHVVITDAAGTTVATTTSTGGIALWDACNKSGTPVNTGVYKVYAAQGSTPSTTGKPVTKIAVIK